MKVSESLHWRSPINVFKIFEKFPSFITENPPTQPKFVVKYSTYARKIEMNIAMLQTAIILLHQKCDSIKII